MDDDVDIETEASAQFGSAQFSEADLQQYYADQEKDEDYGRNVGAVGYQVQPGEDYEDAPVLPSIIPSLPIMSNEDSAGHVDRSDVMDHSRNSVTSDIMRKAASSHGSSTHVSVDIEGDEFDEGEYLATQLLS